MLQMGSRLRRRRCLEIRGERVECKSGQPIFKVFYRVGKDYSWKVMPLLTEHYQQSVSFSWGLGDTKSELQLAFAVLMTIMLKEYKQPRTSDVIENVWKTTDKFAETHVRNLPDNWYLRAKPNSKYIKPITKL